MSLLDLIANSALFGSPLRQGGAELLQIAGQAWLTPFI
jgi:hypothetical protein